MASQISIHVQKKISHQFSMDISIDAGSNRSMCLFGRSGSGKTSLLEMIAGLTTPDKGTIKIGRDVFFCSTQNINLPIEKRHIGYVFQDSRLFPHMTVEKNLKYGYRGDTEHIKQTEILNLLELWPLLTQQPHHLSGGEKQRVAIARALLAEPSLLLLDEPLAALDQKHKSDILHFLADIRQKLRIPMIYVTHAIDEVMRLGDDICIIDAGQSKAFGSVEDITSQPDLYPLTGKYQAGSVLQGLITGYKQDGDLACVNVSGQEITIASPHDPNGTPLQAGSSIRIRVSSRDVILAKSRPYDMSANTILKATIRRITMDQKIYADILLDIGCSLWCSITRHSVQRLDLKEGDTVYAIIKTASIERRATTKKL